MNKRIFRVIIMLSLMIMAVVPSALSFGVYTHFQLTEDSWDLTKHPENAGPIHDIITKNEDTKSACRIGSIAADFAVIYYFSNRESYSGTHHFSLSDRILDLANTKTYPGLSRDEALAFAYCTYFHGSADAISHNYHIPDKIDKYKVPNAIIHPLVEVGLDAYAFRPEMTGYYTGYEKFMPLWNEASGRDWSKEAKILADAVGSNTFYTTAFAPPSTSFTGNFYRYAQKFFKLFIDDKPSIPYKELSQEAITEVYQGTHISIDPDGFHSLDAADSRVNFWKWIIGIGILILLFVIGWRRGWI